MNQRYCLPSIVIAITLWCNSTAIALAKAGEAYPSGVSWGLMLTQKNNSKYAMAFEFQSPSFTMIEMRGGFQSRYSLYLLSANYILKNYVRNADGTKFEESSITDFSGGLQWLHSNASGKLANYVQFGFIYLPHSLAKDFYTKSVWGGRMAGGLSFFFGKTTDEVWLGKSTSFFVQTELVAAMPPTDNLPINLDVFNGVQFSLGVRKHF